MRNEDRKIVLCILDGWGMNPVPMQGNATLKAQYFWKLMNQYPHTYLNASGLAVGLPAGQMGNSEVGHMTIGLGRVLKQDLCRINDALCDQTFFELPAFQDFIQYLKNNNSCCHIAGLLSPGGVHSHIQHMISIVQHLAENNIPTLIHAILDGRDTPPQSAEDFLNSFEACLPDSARIVSICGRFFAMDRDQRWDRTEQAYQLWTEQKSNFHSKTTQEAIKHFYQANITDEFILPTTIGEAYEAAETDGFLMTNFRSDRARQIINALGNPDFRAFKRTIFPRFGKLLSMTEYDETFQSFCTPIILKDSLVHSLGEEIAQSGRNQIRIAETEKYAHVTFFFNGGKEEALQNEKRFLIPSPKVKTYDQAPQMSADAITQEVLQIIKQQSADFLLINYANADMLGHTGILEKAEESICCVDQCLEKLVQSVIEKNYILLITADHGNAEQMQNRDGSPNTAHTNNLVPLIAINLPDDLSLIQSTAQIDNSDFGLSDIAPTILKIFNIEKPLQMTGISLIQKRENHA